MLEDFAYEIRYWVDLLTQGYDSKINTYGTLFLDTKISSCMNDQLTHAIVNSSPIASVQILTYYKKPWENGFILNVPGLTNYRGFIEPDPDVKSDHILYA